MIGIANVVLEIWISVEMMIIDTKMSKGITSSKDVRSGLRIASEV